MADKNEKITSYLKEYNSYSGCDILATVHIDDKHFVLGELQTISYSTNMDRRPIRAIGNINAKAYVQGPRTIAGSLVFAVFNKHVFKEIAENIVGDAYNGVVLPDELPPFDVSIVFANEYGHASRMAIYGVRLVNEGQVLSVNDIYIENTYQYVATSIDLMESEDVAYTLNVSKENNTDTSNNNTDKFIKTNSSVLTDDTTSDLSSLTQKIKIIKKKDWLYKTFDDIEEVVEKGYISFDLENKNGEGTVIVKDAVADVEYRTFFINDYTMYPLEILEIPVGEYEVYYEHQDYTTKPLRFTINESVSNKTKVLPPLISNIDADVETGMKTMLLSDNNITSNVMLVPSDLVTNKMQYVQSEKRDIKKDTKWLDIIGSGFNNNEYIVKGIHLNTPYCFRSCSDDANSEVVEVTLSLSEYRTCEDIDNIIEYYKPFLTDNEYNFYKNMLLEIRSKVNSNTSLFEACIDAKNNATSTQKEMLNNLIFLIYESSNTLSMYNSQDSNTIQVPKIINRKQAKISIPELVNKIKVEDMKTGFCNEYYSSVFRSEYIEGKRMKTFMLPYRGNDLKVTTLDRYEKCSYPIYFTSSDIKIAGITPHHKKGYPAPSIIDDKYSLIVYDKGIFKCDYENTKLVVQKKIYEDTNLIEYCEPLCGADYSLYLPKKKLCILDDVQYCLYIVDKNNYRISEISYYTSNSDENISKNLLAKALLKEEENKHKVANFEGDISIKSEEALLDCLIENNVANNKIKLFKDSCIAKLKLRYDYQLDNIRLFKEKNNIYISSGLSNIEYEVVFWFYYKNKVQELRTNNSTSVDITNCIYDFCCCFVLSDNTVKRCLFFNDNEVIK